MGDERDKERDEVMLGKLWDADVELKRAAGAEGMTLREMSAWARKPENRQTAAGLREWADAAAQMMLSRHRWSAVSRLIEIAHKAKGEETARKACVNVIVLNVTEPEVLEGKSMGGTVRPYSDEEFLEVLKKKGVGSFERANLVDDFVSKGPLRRE